MTTAPAAARPLPGTLPPAAAPRPHGTGHLPAITTPPTLHPTPPIEEPPAPNAYRQAGLTHHQERIAVAEARVAVAAANPTLGEELRQQVRNTPTPAPAVAAAQLESKRPWFDRNGPKLAMYAAVGLCASGEYALARLAGFPGLIAALLPIAMDVYVIQSMRRHRDVAAALLLSVLANALDRLAEARLFGVDRHGHATWWLIVSVVAIAPFIVWRVHRITETKPAKRRETTPAETKTGETTTPVSHTETKTETAETKPRETSETSRETKTETGLPAQVSHRETSETSTRETTRETEIKQQVSRRETRSPRPAQAPVRRETTTAAVTEIGDRETETKRLLDLMKARGGPLTVSLEDAITETGRPKSTAAKRLAAARQQYAA